MEPAGKEPRLPGSARTPKARGRPRQRGPNGTEVGAGGQGWPEANFARQRGERAALSDGGAGLGARELGARARSCTWH